MSSVQASVFWKNAFCSAQALIYLCTSICNEQCLWRLLWLFYTCTASVPLYQVACFPVYSTQCWRERPSVHCRTTGVWERWKLRECRQLTDTISSPPWPGCSLSGWTRWILHAWQFSLMATSHRSSKWVTAWNSKQLVGIMPTVLFFDAVC